MYTPQSLRDIADIAEAAYEKLSKDHPPGILVNERSETYGVMLKARVCAEWMEANGLTELEYVGPFPLGEYAVRRGQRVLVRKGSRIFGTKPGTPREGVVSRRDQVVTVHSVHRGHIDHATAPYSVRQPVVNWAGAGGYWRRTEISNVEIVA